MATVQQGHGFLPYFISGSDRGGDGRLRDTTLATRAPRWKSIHFSSIRCNLKVGPSALAARGESSRTLQDCDRRSASLSRDRRRNLEG
jgi:hypothetical protein